MKQKLINTSQNATRLANTVYVVAGAVAAVLAGLTLLGVVNTSQAVKAVVGAYLVAQAVVVLVAQVYKGTK